MDQRRWSTLVRFLARWLNALTIAALGLAAICCASSRRPPLRRYCVIPVARNV